MAAFLLKELISTSLIVLGTWKSKKGKTVCIAKTRTTQNKKEESQYRVNSYVKADILIRTFITFISFKLSNLFSPLKV